MPKQSVFSSLFSTKANPHCPQLPKRSEKKEEIQQSKASTYISEIRKIKERLSNGFYPKPPALKHPLHLESIQQKEKGKMKRQICKPKMDLGK
jgi:hypothetical protein